MLCQSAFLSEFGLFFLDSLIRVVAMLDSILEVSFVLAAITVFFDPETVGFSCFPFPVVDVGIIAADAVSHLALSLND